MDRESQILSAEDLRNFISGGGMALVEVWAGWSGTSFLVSSTVCRVLSGGPRPSVRLGRIEADQAPELLKQMGIGGPPALLLFIDGEIAARHQGLITRGALEGWIDGPHRSTEQHPEQHSQEEEE